MIESEKKIERKLDAEVKKLGGWTFKLLATHVTGLPDRICLIPFGRIFFAELKTTGKKPSRIQLSIHGKLKKLGFRVEIIDSSQRIKEILEEYE